MKRWFGRQAVAWLGRFWQARDRLLTLAVCGAFGRFGKGSRIVWPLRMGGTLDGVEFGTDVYLGSGCWLQAVAKGGNPKPRILIGNRVLASGSLVLSAAEEILIEDSVLFARNVYISDHIHRYDLETPIRDQGVAKIAPVRIGEGAWLGQNVVVCPGVTIGAGAVIGAGSVVNKDIPPRCLAVGSPARVVRQHPLPSDDAPSP